MAECKEQTKTCAFDSKGTPIIVKNDESDIIPAAVERITNVYSIQSISVANFPKFLLFLLSHKSL